MYQGMQGGLYPEGKNTRPPLHDAAGLALANEIRPLDAWGNVDPVGGKIVLISVGMSNTTQEFSRFIQIVSQDRAVNPQFIPVDGAQGGKTAAIWSDAHNPVWLVLDQRLAATGVTSNQVQVAWIKLANARPTEIFPEDARIQQRQMATVVQILKQRFPNLKIAYLSSRIYGVYALKDLNPEPYAYQSGFAVKWLIEEQINGSPNLNYDPAKGEVKAPWLSWGPYLWADGLRPRSDGLIWECDDLSDDGTHPSIQGRTKVANLLLTFLKTDPTARPWFLKAS